MMKSAPEELGRFSSLPDFTYRRRGEWSSACPACGGADIQRRDKSDRFRIFEASGTQNVRGWCRSCGHFEWADAAEPQSAEQRLASKIERLRLAKKERARIRNKIEKLREASYWQGWHDAMSAEHRHLWHREGIIDWAIDEYKLGYCPSYKLSEDYSSPTMTIPHYDVGWKLVNVQHRLLKPPEPGDKYRQLAGLPAAFFLTDPSAELKGECIIVEGAKKAIVTYLHIGQEKKIIVGVPSKTPSAKMLERFADCEPIYIMLDPDAYDTTNGLSAAGRMAKSLGLSRVRFVRLPAKPDDILVKLGGSASDMMRFIKMATRP